MSRNTKAESAAIRKILHEDWDPIGCGVPEDEYDSYVWPIYALLVRNAGREDVMSYLRRAADEQIRCSVSELKLGVVVDKLMALDFGQEPLST